MVNDSDLDVGQIYEIDLPTEEALIRVEFIETTADGRFVFRQLHIAIPIMIDKFVWDGMRSTGAAVLLERDGQGNPMVEREIDPASLLDPDEGGITVNERNKRLRAAQLLKEARTLRFYVMLYDDDPSVGRGHVSVDRFVLEHSTAAKEAGFDWLPSAGSILRAVKECGAPNSRPLSAFYDERGKHDRARRWPTEVLELAAKASTFYWAKRANRLVDAIQLFIDGFKMLRVERESLGPITPENPYNRPTEETIRNWIKAEMNIFTWANKYGEKDALRRFRGRGRALQATRPLELVMFDHTRIDVWAVVQDENGQLLFVERPWMTVGIDCYSRMVLGAVLTYEHPSIHSITECMRHVIRRKDELLQRFPDFVEKRATDGYGKPFTIVVDNGWEFTGGSFQTSCENANINVMWAPVKIPMFKAYVERLFRTVNQGIWHLLDGGIPLTPKDRSLLDLKPEVDAVHDRQRLEDLLWQWIVTQYHMEVHSDLNMAPARKWGLGIAAKGRPKVRDVREFDKVIGFTRDCQLSGEGIFFDGERFHDPAVTTLLMSDIARHGKAREQRKGVTSSKTVWVMVTANPGNADHVHVRNPRTGEQVKLPNWNLIYSKGTPWHVLKKVREFAKKQNLAFWSDEDKAAARVAFMEAMGRALPGQKFAQQRKLAPLLDPRPELVPGDAVTIRELEDGETVIHDLADEATRADRKSTKGKRPGGMAATEKAMQTKARNKKAKEEAAVEAAKPQAVDPANAPLSAVEEVDDAAAMLKAIMDRIKKDTNNG